MWMKRKQAKERTAYLNIANNIAIYMMSKNIFLLSQATCVRGPGEKWVVSLTVVRKVPFKGKINSRD